MGPGGIAGEEGRARPLLNRVDAILCPVPNPSCGVGSEASALAPVAPGKRPKLTGALDRGSTAAQILLLEYAEGMPMESVGWGRASPADVAALSELHATEFRLVARPLYVARANLARLTPLMAGALTDPGGPAVTMISGHDTNVASLGGLLDLHWRVPGLAADDPSPGGAIVLERLVDRAGQHYVRALYRSQTLADIRGLLPVRRAYVTAMPIRGCQALGVKGLCSEAAFLGLLSGR
jgi:4-phytase / acid phosphatase